MQGDIGDDALDSKAPVNSIWCAPGIVRAWHHTYPFAPGKVAQLRRVRFRTLGCWPLTAAIESDATTLDAVIAETLGARGSAREGRLIDSDVPGSMEKKKQEGYF